MAESARAPPRVYQNIVTKDNSVNHFGDYHASQRTRKEKLLQSLYFDGIHHPRELEAFQGTYEWVFEDEQTTFPKWACSSESVFWISGKLGSGKSTLMRFLSKHKRSRSLLSEWANGRRLVILDYFFWSAGDIMQKSRRGLMQALLYQLVAESKDSTLEVVASDRETNDDHAWRRPWTRLQLSQTLQTLILELSPDCRFCIFVDGLDEYELGGTDEGGHDELLTYLQTLAASPLVKLCVSSRPWKLFEEAFEDLGRSQIVMQNLTKGDMETYVRGCLEDNHRFRTMLTNDRKAAEVVERIGALADGVFLWVALAVKDVSNGLTEQDDLETLIQRVGRLPQGLEALLERIFQAIKDGPYAMLAARVLLAILTQHSFDRKTTCSLLELSSLKELARDPDSALKARPHSIPFAEMRTMIECTNRSLHTWCKDLLEIRRWEEDDADEFESTIRTPGLATSVSFAHRTIFEFVASKSTSDLAILAGEDFDARLEIARMMLHAFKSMKPARDRRPYVAFFLGWLSAVANGSEAEDYYRIFTSFEDASSMPRLKFVINSNIVSRAPVTDPCWYWAQIDCYPKLHPNTHPSRASSSISAALLWGLPYIARRTFDREKDCLTPHKLQYIFSLALVWGKPHINAPIRPRVQRDLVEGILDMDMTLSVSEPTLTRYRTEYSVWQIFLSSFARAGTVMADLEFHDEHWPDIVWAVTRLLRLGGDPNATIRRRDIEFGKLATQEELSEDGLASGEELSESELSFEDEPLSKDDVSSETELSSIKTHPKAIENTRPQYAETIPAVRVFEKFEELFAASDHPQKHSLVAKYCELRYLLESAALKQAHEAEETASKADRVDSQLWCQPWFFQ